ncbi:MAG: sigma-70 family RNA polymerase sigma factor, partial [Dermatophilaceae bacterium]
PGPDAMIMTDDVKQLLDALERSAGAEDEVAASFTAWWSSRDDRAHELLDALAAGAADATWLGVLLRLCDQFHLARSGVRRVLLDEHDVADAEQAALAATALGVGNFDGRSRFTTWLHQVALNEARMLIRTRDRRPSTPVAEMPEATASAFVARISTLVADQEALRAALDNLAEPLREVLLLREARGLSYEEVAAALDVPVGTVRSRLNRARSVLAQALRPPTN